ncbi:MAG TPA: hypothetical protein VGV89_09880 [Thermoplasmata archaeon]|nr:hypothetical protein [Thermoplasmata archaeon]
MPLDPTSHGLVWVNESDVHGPPGLAGAGVAYDPVLGRVVVFGGCTSGDYWAFTCTPGNGTWEYHAGVWVHIRTMHTPPSRFRPGMTYDPVGGVVVLFGGSTAGNGSLSFNDTWTFNGDDWTNRTSTVAPTPRLGPAMASDARGLGVLLFGGLPTTTASTTDQDTWWYAAGTWTEKFPAHSPTGRYDAGMTTDTSRGGEVLATGYNASSGAGGNVGDTWLFSNGDWTAINPTNPPPARNGAGLAYDPIWNVSVLFGGHAGGLYYSDTWVLRGAQWASPSMPAAPSARWGAEFIFDAADNYSLYFGGFQLAGGSVSQYFNDTWTFGGMPLSLVGVAEEPSNLTLSVGASSTVQAAAFVFGGSSPAFPVNYTWGLLPAGLGTLNSSVGTVIRITAGSTAGTAVLYVQATGNRTTVYNASEVTIVTSTTSPSLASVAVLPHTASVRLGSSVGFSAVAFSSTGSDLTNSTAFAWTISGDSSSRLNLSSGSSVTYTPSSAAVGVNVGIMVRATYGGLTRVAAATVRVASAPPPPIPTLSVVALLPANTTVVVGGNLTLSAWAVASDGSDTTSSVTFNWTLLGTSLGSLNRSDGPVVQFYARDQPGTVHLLVFGVSGGTTVSASATIVIVPPIGGSASGGGSTPPEWILLVIGLILGGVAGSTLDYFLTRPARAENPSRPGPR